MHILSQSMSHHNCDATRIAEKTAKLHNHAVISDDALLNPGRRTCSSIPDTQFSSRELHIITFRL